MALQILNAGTTAEDTALTMRRSIESALPGATVDVGVNSPGHFQIRVRSAAFEGKGRVAQQQLVYRAITHLMSGPNAPVHAVDRLECLLP
jgi:acid stress-induced BolA-like protein IbaG/YrbA